MALTDTKVKNANVPEGKKQAKIADGGGLYLLVTSTGKYWRLKYRFAGKEKTLAIGVYPTVSLKKARQVREAAKESLSEGIDPNFAKKEAERLKRAEQDAATFEGVAREWHKEHSKHVSAKYAKKVIVSLERDIFPWLGQLPIGSIKAIEVLNSLKRVADRGAEETARRLKTLCSQVFCYAVLHHELEQDPTTSIKGFLRNKKEQHYATITEPKKVGDLLRTMQTYEGAFQVRCALLMMPYVFVRPGELRQAEWSEFDLKERVWKLPAEKMKMKEMHIVPLSKQVIAILEDLFPFSGQGKYLFPSIRTNLRPISDNTLNGALRRLGFDKTEITGHGFRGMASTLLHERGYNSDYIERQLAHKEGNAIKAAYNHARHLDERTAMMQEYADYLDSLREA